VHREHYAALVRLASLLVDDMATCEELVQDAFVAVFRRPDRVQSPDKLPAYLRSAVLNGARSALRRRQVRERPALRVVATEPSSPEGSAVAADDHRAVLEAVRALPDRQRDVLVLRFWGELSEGEIAEVLGIASGTVKTHAKRGLDALADALEDRQ
jgi:RNA polymerase sigma-70 factor (sigma-E family)